MFNWFNMKKKSLPQQVLENTKDIEKLFDQELSDITQLNYKQDAEDSLTYADGKATFKGKMSIIRNENTQNIVVDSDIEVNISSGDDDIIIDAGEDNVSLKIRLDNEARNKINRALLTPITTPNEREFVAIGTNNAQEMISESELYKGLEIVETLYDKNSLDSNINLGFTSGLKFVNNYTGAVLRKNKDDYDLIRVTCRFDDDSRKQTFTAVNRKGFLTRILPCCTADWNGAYLCMASVSIYGDGNIYTGNCKTYHLENSLSTINYSDNDKFYIEKIEGVKIK